MEKWKFSCTIMRNWVGEVPADFSFHVWVGGQFFLGDHEIKISDSTEGVDGSNISIYGFYLLKAARLL